MNMLRIVVISVAAAALAYQSFPSHGEGLQAGVAVVDITPPVPWRMSGYFYERVSTGVKDPLQAKAIVLKQGEVTAALVFCDLVGVPRTVSDRVRRSVHDATGISVDNVVVAATHTHTGPLYYGPLRELFHQRAVERSGSDPNESIDYPAASDLPQPGRKEPLAVFGSEFAITAKVMLAATVPAGDVKVPGTLRYQACNDTVCFPPTRATAEWVLSVTH